MPFTYYERTTIAQLLLSVSITVNVWSPWASIRYDTEHYEGTMHMEVESSIEPPTPASQGLAELVKVTHVNRNKLNEAMLANDLEKVFLQFSQQRAK